MERERQPGTETADPAEGRRDDDPATTDTPHHPEQPGTKTLPPAEGGDDTSGTGRPAR